MRLIYSREAVADLVRLRALIAEHDSAVNCQEATREQLLASLRVTLAEAIEFNRDEASAPSG